MVKELPSRFIPYPKNIKVKYRTYTWSEIDYINQSNLDYAEILDFCSKGIMIDGMDVYDLTYMDFMYLCILRKLSSLGSDSSKFKVMFNAFGKAQTADFAEKDLEFEDLMFEALPIKAKCSVGTLEFMPVTLRQMLELKKYSDPGCRPNRDRSGL